MPLGADGFVKDRSGQVVKSRLDEETLKKIALDHRRRLRAAASGRASASIRCSATTSRTMERRELASALERRYEERFQIPLALALLLLVVESAGAAAPRGARRARGVGAAGRRQRAAGALVAAAPAARWSAGSIRRAIAPPRATSSTPPASTTRRRASTAKD